MGRNAHDRIFRIETPASIDAGQTPASLIEYRARRTLRDMALGLVTVQPMIIVAANDNGTVR